MTKRSQFNHRGPAYLHGKDATYRTSVYLCIYNSSTLTDTALSQSSRPHVAVNVDFTLHRISRFIAHKTA